MRQQTQSPSLGKILSDLSLEKFATSLRADFRFAPLNTLLLVAIFVVGFIVHLNLNTYSIEALLLFLGSALILAGMIRITQVWEAVVILGTADCLVGYLYLRPHSEIFLITIAVALIVAPPFRSPTNGRVWFCFASVSSGACANRESSWSCR